MQCEIPWKKAKWNQEIRVHQGNRGIQSGKNYKKNKTLLKSNLAEELNAGEIVQEALPHHLDRRRDQSQAATSSI